MTVSSHTSTRTVWIEGNPGDTATDAVSHALVFVRDRLNSIRPLTLLFRRSGAAEQARRTLQEAKSKRLIPVACLVYIDTLPR